MKANFRFLCSLVASAAIAQSAVYTTLYSFKGSPDGAKPHAAVVIGKDGALYGTTYVGGTTGSGTIFQLTTADGVSWSETVLHNFTGTDGALPAANMVFNSTGALFGTTVSGGSTGFEGAVYELTPPTVLGGTWIETVVYSYAGYRNGLHSPLGAVLIGPNGTLYTTTAGAPAQGSIAYAGTVDALAPPSVSGGSWTEFTIYNLGRPDELAGVNPYAGVVFEAGSLYGTTLFTNSIGGCGAVYELTPPTSPGAWTETTIHTFGTQAGDGCEPMAALTVGSGGVLYGTTYVGGSGVPCNYPVTSGCGTIFRLTPPTARGGAWTETTIYSFSGVSGDGAYPDGGVVVDRNGTLYGTTRQGGDASTGFQCRYYGVSGCGTVFSLTPPATPGGTWTEKVLHSFSGQNGDGAFPLAGLALGPSGMLYGTAAAGGTTGSGTVFSVKP